MSKSRGKNALDSLNNENVLQAVVIVDTYSRNLTPFCNYMPTSLVPLTNRPLLDYTLECLMSSGVQEVILFCSSFADQVRDFVREDKWPGLSVSVVVSEGCRTFGDVMRDLDAKALIRSDFILLTGNMVGNLQLLPILETHKRIQKVDKGSVMTLIFKEHGHRSTATEDDFTVALNTKTNRVLLYSKKSRNPRKIEIPMETVLETSEMTLRSDLLDTQVCVCSVAVPPLFSDNFDFQSKDDFVRGLLVNEEILASSIYAYILPGSQYAATVNSWAHYQDITHDVIHRWVYPLVPDMLTDDPYFFRRNNIYIQRDITLSQGCKLEEDVVIGSESSVGQNAIIARSVIGKNCKIGNNVVIESSYIMDHVKIQDNVSVSYSVVGPRCELQSGASVTNGSVLGSEVIIDSNKQICALKLQSYPSDSCGQVGSKAFLCDDSADDDSDSDSDTREAVAGLRVGRGETHYESDYTESSDSDDEMTHSLSVPEDTNLFYTEVVDSLVRGFEDKLLCDNLVLEINSSRYAYNVTMSEVNFHVVRALLTLPAPDGHSWQHLVTRLTYFMPILTNYIRSQTAQKDCLLAIEDVAGSNPEIFAVLVKIIHWLYEQDILSEDNILNWYKNPSVDADPENSKRVRQQVAPFIRWLEEAEEDEDDDDDID
ncbi:translation initiation factor eIF-2B subunit epsilon-like [Macrosteles quadrilineatus]|uniref:translation initiation factor eIF-2B subunit epsilon-like n=1 Tax=Macrosteles quadrilineatus TaxID=74068 RepID=UPI0023E3063E|nr:translation initiation factor eIF-2B subunit epsilon-like isoform X2 [Macrosteles quadrilineatus]XP_054276368.1 translation initiation factor eIF-2B subunit epsilon-like [Macrosteles quadrilineatus]